MTDFFDDLEHELRRAHRRDTRSGARAGRPSLRWLPGLPVAVLRPLLVLAAVAALVAVIVTVARESEVEQPAVTPPSRSTPAPESQGGCNLGEPWEAPIVDEPIPRAIASRFAILRDPRSSGAKRSRGDAIIEPQVKKLYRGAVALRRRLDTGRRFYVLLIPADIASAQPDRDYCAPPPGPTAPGICFYAGAGTPSLPLFGRKCFTIDEIEDGQAWFSLTRNTAVGLAPDGVDRVSFDTPAGTQSLSISGNVFAGEVRSVGSPADTEARFAP